jgi:hypothetical protein
MVVEFAFGEIFLVDVDEIPCDIAKLRSAKLKRK